MCDNACSVHGFSSFQARKWDHQVRMGFYNKHGILGAGVKGTAVGRVQSADRTVCHRVIGVWARAFQSPDQLMKPGLPIRHFKSFLFAAYWLWHFLTSQRRRGGHSCTALCVIHFLNCTFDKNYTTLWFDDKFNWQSRKIEMSVLRR